MLATNDSFETINFTIERSFIWQVRTSKLILKKH